MIGGPLVPSVLFTGHPPGEQSIAVHAGGMRSGEDQINVTPPLPTGIQMKGFTNGEAFNKRSMMLPNRDDT